MTGRIEVLATADKPGRITYSSGGDSFHYTYQLTPGKTDGLSLGGLVTFELERGNPEIAVGVCPKDQEKSSQPAQSRPEVRYQGFEQQNGIRSFRFRAWRTGEENQEAIVTADLALFRKHGITIQEGPALCLRFVQAELQQPSPTESQVWKRALTDNEMLAHVAGRRTSVRKRT